jgi:signal transduction histidine kinase/ActR/RegA family two-component response regulator
MHLSELAQHLRATQEAVMQRWMAAVYRDGLESALGLSEPQLRDHLPVLLDEIVLALEEQDTPLLEHEGQEHGRQRWGSGYNIGEMLRELAILREMLLAVTTEYAEDTPGLTRAEELEAGQRIRLVLDRSGQASVEQYHAETLAGRWLLEAELRAASDQKDRFLAMVSHELRNPLAPILTAVQLLEFTETDDPRLRQAREIIERQVRHQVRLVDDLLDVSRIAQGKIALRLEARDLKAELAYAIRGSVPAIEARKQELHAELPDEPLMVDVDPVRLEQIVTNLLSNASKYTEPRGTIWLTANQEGEKAVIRVRDTGVGISPEFLPRVFALFAQADAPLERAQGGLGIGLAIVKHLVELHGGTVEARSEGPGKGSEFVVRLPLIRNHAPSALLPTDEEQHRRRRRVALVESNDDSRTVLAEVLELLGYPVVTAANGPAALRLVEEHRPEVFVVNIGLPGMSGYELARALRAMPGGGQMLLIALTGYGRPEELELAREAGFDAHLTKPADIEELQGLLDRSPVSG